LKVAYSSTVLTSEIGGIENSASRFGRDKRWIGGCVDTTAVLYVVAHSKFPASAGNRILVIASYFSDWAVSAHAQGPATKV
jgi:hypothetical protein